MNVNVMYTFCDRELSRYPLHVIDDDDERNVIISASVWLTDHLNLSFQTMEDLDRVINALYDLRHKIADHVVATGKQLHPDSTYSFSQIVDISVHDTNTGEIDPALIGTPGDSSSFEVLRITSLNGEANTLRLFFPHGQKGSIKRFAQNILGKYEEGMSNDTEAGDIGPSEEARGDNSA